MRLGSHTLSVILGHLKLRRENYDDREKEEEKKIARFYEIQIKIRESHRDLSILVPTIFVSA